GDAKLPKQPGDDRGAEDDDNELAAPFRREQAALDDDEEQRDRRRDAAEENRLERVPADAVGGGELGPWREIRVDRRRDTDRAARLDARRADVAPRALSFARSLRSHPLLPASRSLP